MDCSMTGFLVLHHLLELVQTQVHWCHSSISFSVVSSSGLQSFPEPGSFPMSWLFASGGQSIGVSTSESVLPMNSQCWFPLGLTGLISLLSKGRSRVFSNTTVWKHQYFGNQSSYGSTLTSVHDYWKNHSFDYMDTCWKVITLLFDTLSRFVIVFVIRSKHLLISWVQSPSTVNLEPKKIKSVTVSVVSPSICYEMMGPDAVILSFWMLSFKTAFSLSSIAFIKRFFSSSSLSAIMVVLSAHLRLLLFLPSILFPA